MTHNPSFIVNLPLPDEPHPLHINVLFFGELAQHIGMNQIEWSLERSTTVEQLKQTLEQFFTHWASFSDPIEQAVNREFVDERAIINIGDEVAFFPSLFEPTFKL